MLSTQQLRIAAFSTAVIAFAATSGGALAQKTYDTGATDTEIKIGNIMPYSGPASAYGVIGKTEAGLLQEDQRRRRHQRPQDQFHHLRRRLQPAQDGRAGAQAGRERRGALRVQSARHAVEFGDPEISERQEGAAAVRRHRRHQMERSEEFPVDHGLAAQLPERGADLRQVPAQGKAGRQDRACSTRTTISARTTSRA